MKAVPDMVGRFVPRRFIPLGTDGYGRSDTRAALRRHFEIDAPSIVVAVLAGLRDEGALGAGAVEGAIAAYGIDPGTAEPRVR